MLVISYQLGAPVKNAVSMSLSFRTSILCFYVVKISYEL